MPIGNIPVIREDYPLFSWEDHQESFAALKQGGEVARFKKETWNEIIEKLQAVLTEGGLSWDSANYTTAENAKITEAYGALSAAMFNAVRHNIDHPVPVGWRWANDSTFRGYVGREDFHGYSEYGAQSDLFYAEYLLEIVRKLNLLIEILRGTAQFGEMEISQAIETPYRVGLVAVPTVPMEANETAQTNHSAVMFAIPLIKMETVHEFVKTSNNAEIFAIPVIKMEPKHENIKTSNNADMAAIPLVVVEANHEFLKSTSEVTLSSLRLKAIGESSGMLKTEHCAEISALPLIKLEAKEARSKTTGSAEITQVKSLPIEATKAYAKSRHSANMIIVPCLALNATGTAKTKQSAMIEKVPTKPMGAEVVSESTTSATLDSAWLPPIRTGNNLHIRQVFDMQRNGNDLRLI